MNYSIIINPSSKKSDAINHAYCFVKALLPQKCVTINVFFYGYAVESLFFNISNDFWHDIGDNVDLMACSTISENFLTQGIKPAKNVRIASLGQWLEALIDADKRLEFV